MAETRATHDALGALDVPLRPGRGYTVESVDALRKAAEEALSNAAAQIEHLHATLELVQAEAAGASTRLDLLAALRKMGPEELRTLGVEAVGLAVIEAEEAAARIKAQARAEVLRLRSEIVQFARAAIRALDEESPAARYDVGRLRGTLLRIAGDG